MESAHVALLVICAVFLFSPSAIRSQTASGIHRADVSAQGLTCDGSVNPLGVDDPQPRFHWILKARAPHLRNLRQTAFQIIVASSRVRLDRADADLWDAKKTSGQLAPSVPYAGKTLLPDTVYYWKVRVWDWQGRASAWSEPSSFLTGLQPTDWSAHWIAASPDGPRQPQANGNDDTRVSSTPPLPIFRHEFSVAKPVLRATLFIAGLGQSETLLNGKPVTQALLTPGWSNYRNTVLYDTYDVTQLLHHGANAIGVLLGNGMYNVEGVKGRYTKFVGSFGQPKLIAELRLHYADGTVAIVASDGHWKTAPGPITFSSIYGGEDYDARRTLPGWTLPSFHDAVWQSVTLVDGPGGQLHSERIPPVEVAHTYTPVRVTHPAPGVAVYDLGQNFAGRPSILVSGPRGSAVRILPGELLNAAGRVTQKSQAASPDAPVVFNYTLGGSGMERWTPEFTYSGFRYLEVTVSGSRDLPHIAALEGQAIHDEAPVDGSFSTSNRLLDRIHLLIDAAIQNNSFSVLTDCPTREKLGWLEQTHLAGPSILFNYDLAPLYRKMAQDMRDSQTADGMVPAIAPEVVAFLDDAGHNTDFRDSPEWGSAIILSPWTAYSFYGDTRPLRENYDAMVAYANYLQSKSKGNLISYGLGDWYDIGPGAPGKSQLTGPAVTATAIDYQDLTALARIAAILGKPSDAAEFARRADAVKAAFNAQLFHPDTGNYDNGSQTANAMALALDLVPPDRREAVLDNLVADIRKHGNHVTAGDIGFHYVVRALTDNGRSDVLYDMLTRTDSPSYGYQLDHGATALTEAWDANPDSSQDHFMLGHAEEWFYRGLAGIDFDLAREQDKRIWIHPQLVGDIQSANASYRSVLGKISSAWARDGNRLRLDVEIPPGTTATITLPAGFSKDLMESGHSFNADNGVSSVSQSDGSISLAIASGTYHFSARK